MNTRNQDLLRWADEIEEAARRMAQRSEELRTVAAQVRQLGQQRQNDRNGGGDAGQ